jgi:SAM-dependent methyltransferase
MSTPNTLAVSARLGGQVREDAVELEVAIPSYLAETYAWAYLRPRAVQLLDREAVVNAILWGNYARLVHAACAQFRPGEQVLQAASVYGSEPLRLADRLGPGGRLTVIDVSRLQVEHLRAKLATRPNATVRLADATAPGRESYDGVCCFFLLHEMPDSYKRRAVNALLSQLKPGGRAVFVDYARPRWFHPLRGLMWLVNRWLEPYAESLWRNPIPSFADQPELFHWSERRLFLGLYQIVLARRRGPR